MLLTAMVLQTWVAWVTKHYLNFNTMIPVTQVMGIVISGNILDEILFCIIRLLPTITSLGSLVFLPSKL